MSGILISNHPSFLDLSLISRLLQIKQPRGSYENVKFLVNKNTHPFYSKYFSKDRFIQSSSEPRKLNILFEELVGWINGGGLFVMFPTRRLTNEECCNLQFETGFQFLLKRLNCDKSIISVSINPKDIKLVTTNDDPVLSEKNADRWFKDRTEPETKYSVRIHMNTSSASVWQASINTSLNNFDNNTKLTNLYKSMHAFNL